MSGTVAEVSGSTLIREAQEVFSDWPPQSEDPDTPCELGPLCGQAGYTCGDVSETDRAELLIVTKDAAPGRPFQRIDDRFHDAGRELVGELVITCEGLAEMQSLGIAVPQFPKGEYLQRPVPNLRRGGRGSTGSALRRPETASQGSADRVGGPRHLVHGARRRVLMDQQGDCWTRAGMDSAGAEDHCVG